MVAGMGVTLVAAMPDLTFALYLPEASTSKAPSLLLFFIFKTYWQWEAGRLKVIVTICYYYFYPVVCADSTDCGG